MDVTILQARGCLAQFLRDQVTELKIGADLQYDKYDDEYIIEF